MFFLDDFFTKTSHTPSRCCDPHHLVVAVVAVVAVTLSHCYNHQQEQKYQYPRFVELT
jgi:hypothetical protein